MFGILTTRYISKCGDFVLILHQAIPALKLLLKSKTRRFYICTSSLESLQQKNSGEGWIF